MKTSLSHLPIAKQNQILEITEIIKEVTKAEKIILFGSYAKGTYVENRYLDKDGTRHEYISDYDFLVVTKDTPLKASDLERDIVNRSGHIDPPVNLEIHSIDYVNKGLELGEYFFVDIVKEGILLYETSITEFSQPKELSSQEKKEKAQRYFDTWFPQAGKFLKYSHVSISESDYKITAFLLHQATESLYYSILLVFTDYKPKTHNLWKLRKKAKPFSEDLYHIFRTEIDKEDKYLFDLLKRGYIDARYRDDYSISEKEAITLWDKVSRMLTIVESLCNKKLHSF
ncbi:MAG: hypothetical protein JWN76_414 [Chitinophagaceae bacterium]|nr:hypothetical protein [Chitinophagaceae bacterium]